MLTGRVGHWSACATRKAAKPPAAKKPATKASNDPNTMTVRLVRISPSSRGHVAALLRRRCEPNDCADCPAEVAYSDASLSGAPCDLDAPIRNEADYFQNVGDPSNETRNSGQNEAKFFLTANSLQNKTLVTNASQIF
jgi:hypothetical protein